MAIAIQKDNEFNINLGSYYTRFAAAVGDVAVISFVSHSKQTLKTQPYNPFFLGSTWGATYVGVEYTLRPDFDKDNDDHWQDHPNRATITAYKSALEGGQIAALRLTFSNAGMYEIWSPTPIEVIE